MNSTVEKIVAGIWADLSDRSGFDLGTLDLDVQEEVRAAWAKIVRDALSAEETKEQS